MRYFGMLTPILSLRTQLCICCSLLLFSNSVIALSDDEVAAYHYSGSIEFEPARGHIKVHWQISVIDSSTETLKFVLRSSLHNVTATGDGIVAVAVGASELGEDFQEINITLETGSDIQPRSFNLSYSGVLLPEPMENLINQVSKDAIELNVDSFWLPMDSRFNQLLTADLEILIPSGWQAVGEGDITPIVDGFRLVSNRPTLDISFALAKNFTITRLAGFTLYDLRENKLGIKKLSSAIDFCVSELNLRFGQTRPLSDIHFTINDRPSSGYARGKYIALTDIADAVPERLTQFVCHEIAHHWSQGGKFDTEENWLNEAFAEYVGMMMLRERFGIDAFEKRLEGFREQLTGETLAPIWTPETTARPEYLVAYRKAPLALSKLEKKIGKEPFGLFVKAYMNNSTSSTEALLAQLEHISSEASANWFKELMAQ
jgi:hypothetical protein